MTVLTLAEAKRLLQKLPSSVKLELLETPEGEIVLTAEKPPTKDDLLKEKYPNLIGKPITLTEAAEKYDIPRTTVQKWHYRSNYIAPLDPDAYPAFFDEAEIAYLADIYKKRRAVGSYAPLLDKDGLPYELKNPDRAKKYRNRRS